MFGSCPFVHKHCVGLLTSGTWLGGHMHWLGLLLSVIISPGQIHLSESLESSTKFPGQTHSPGLLASGTWSPGQPKNKIIPLFLSDSMYLRTKSSLSSMPEPSRVAGLASFGIKNQWPKTQGASSINCNFKYISTSSSPSRRRTCSRFRKPSFMAQITSQTRCWITARCSS